MSSSATLRGEEVRASDCTLHTCRFPPLMFSWFLLPVSRCGVPLPGQHQPLHAGFPRGGGGVPGRRRRHRHARAADGRFRGRTEPVRRRLALRPVGQVGRSSSRPRPGAFQSLSTCFSLEGLDRRFTRRASDVAPATSQCRAISLRNCIFTMATND